MASAFQLRGIRSVLEAKEVREMKSAMTSLYVALLCSGMFIPSAFAESSQADSGSSLLLSLFVGFFALIVVFQLVPACLMFIGMLKGIFVRQKTMEKNVR